MLSGAFAVSLLAGNRLESGGVPLWWRDGKLTLHISRTVHLAEGTTGVDARESAAAVHTALLEAIRVWNSTGYSSIEITPAWTDAVAASTVGENVVTFTDFAPYDSGLCDREKFLACTILSVSPEDSSILGVAIAFNPYKRHSASGFAGTHDLGLVMMHEIGHAIGLDHSAVLDSVMSPAVDMESETGAACFARRQLAMDDILTLAAAYPLEERLVSWPLAAGTVNRNGVGLGAAHVVVLDEGGMAVTGRLTDDKGRFSFRLPPGAYYLAVEPLDGPVFLNQMTSPRAVPPSFPTSFWTPSGGAPDEALKVVLEEWLPREDLHFHLPESAGPKLDTVGVIAHGRYLGYPRILLARGRDYTLAASRSDASGPPTLELFQLPGATDGTTTVPAGAPQLVRRKVRFAADAPLGAWSLRYRDDNGVALMPGAVRLVVNPRIAAVVDPSTGAPVEKARAGQALRIEGVDLAEADLSAPLLPDGLPPPNQLGGISVRVNDRLAPLLAVSPNAVICILPSGLEGDSLTLAVISGPDMESEAFRLHLLPE